MWHPFYACCQCFQSEKMYRRDYILNEARKFAALLAKLLGLKTEGSGLAFEQETAAALGEEFNTNLPKLIDLSEEEFTRLILSADYSAEKLNALGSILYIHATPLQKDSATIALAQKILLVYNLLEQQHHYQTFENIGRRAELENFLS